MNFGHQVFIFLVAFAVGTKAPSAHALCNLQRMIDNLKALGDRKVSPYKDLPDAVRHTLELRDVFTPMIKTLESKVARLDETAIAKGIETADREGIYVGKATFGRTIELAASDPPSAFKAASTLRFNYGYIDDRRFWSGDKYFGNSTFTGHFKEFITQLPKSTENFN